MTIRNNQDYLQDILDAIQEATKFIGDKTYPQFLQDRKTCYAIIHCLEIIGEASKKVSPSFKTKYPHVPWKQMGDMRNFLIHGYFSVDPETIWETVKNDLPDLKEKLKAIPL